VWRGGEKSQPTSTAAARNGSQAERDGAENWVPPITTPTP
jgi:hypothetical protein